MLAFGAMGARPVAKPTTTTSYALACGASGASTAQTGRATAAVRPSVVAPTAALQRLSAILRLAQAASVAMASRAAFRLQNENSSSYATALVAKVIDASRGAAVTPAGSSARATSTVRGAASSPSLALGRTTGLTRAASTAGVASLLRSALHGMSLNAVASAGASVVRRIALSKVGSLGAAASLTRGAASARTAAAAAGGSADVAIPLAPVAYVQPLQALVRGSDLSGRLTGSSPESFAARGTAVEKVALSSPAGDGSKSVAKAPQGVGQPGSGLALRFGRPLPANSAPVGIDARLRRSFVAALAAAIVRMTAAQASLLHVDAEGGASAALLRGAAKPLEGAAASSARLWTQRLVYVPAVAAAILSASLALAIRLGVGAAGGVTANIARLFSGIDLDVAKRLIGRASWASLMGCGLNAEARGRGSESSLRGRPD